MYNFDLPAGVPVRLTATARHNAGPHRWDLQVLAAETGALRSAYGSHIGARDLDQRIDIPAQAEACRLEVRSRHYTMGGWADDRASIDDSTPSQLRVAFCEAAGPHGSEKDVVLSFAFRGVQSAEG